MISVRRVRAQPGVSKLLFIRCRRGAIRSMTCWPAAPVTDTTGLRWGGDGPCVGRALMLCSGAGARTVCECCVCACVRTECWGLELRDLGHPGACEQNLSWKLLTTQCLVVSAVGNGDSAHHSSR